MIETTLEPQLRAILIQARRIAAAFGVSVAPRELLLAAAVVQPQLVVATARRCGIEVRRLLWAMLEWGPVAPAAPKLVAGVALTPEAQALVVEVAQKGSGRACEGLISRLLDPVRLAPRLVGAPGSGTEGDGPRPDATGLVLSRLGLI